MVGQLYSARGRWQVLYGIVLIGAVGKLSIIRVVCRPLSFGFLLQAICVEGLFANWLKLGVKLWLFSEGGSGVLVPCLLRVDDGFLSIRHGAYHKCSILGRHLNGAAVAPLNRVGPFPAR